MQPTLAPPQPRRRRPPRRYTEEEYLAYERSPERASEARTELHANGRLVEMAGARRSQACWSANSPS